MRELKKLKVEYKKLLIKDIKLSIKHKRTINMLDKLELWRILKLKKEIDEMNEFEENQRQKEISRFHI